MKNIYLLFAFIFMLNTALFSQNIVPKLSLDLMAIYLDSSQIYKDNTSLPVLIKGSEKSIKKVIEKGNKSVCKWCVKDICSVDLKLNEIDDFLLEKGVWQMEFRWAKAQKMDLPDDTIHLQNNNITPVHLGENPLPKTYKGNGVLLGVIDDGFEVKHPDFLQADSTTRVLYLWDQSDDHNTYTHNLNYGSLWTKNHIDNNNCRQEALAHGTHVLGIAAGNAQASGKYIGVAPQADLLLVKIQENSNSFLPRFVDAIHFFAEKSRALNKPCAINSSVGVYGSSRDGKDLYSQAISNILANQNGLALVQAAGNAREAKMHVHTNLQIGDTAITAFDYHNTARKTHFFLYADTADFKDVYFTLECLNSTYYQLLHQSQSFNIKADFSTPDNTSARYIKPFVINANGVVSYMDIRIANYNGVYEIWIQILQNSTSISLQFWQLKSFGKGKFDIYASEGYLSTSNMKNYLPIAHYNPPTQTQNIVGYWTCAEAVIAVSAYQNQSRMINYGGDTISLLTANYPEGGIAPFSSIGLTRDGRQKPNIAAPGGQVISAATLADIDYYKRLNYAYLNEDGWHVSNRGTSMAAPFVAGALALYYECNPNASNEKVREELYASARLDTFVFRERRTVPNEHWGMGKLDVFNLLKSCLIYGCTDSLALNYNPLANVDNGGCYTLVNTNEINANNGFKIYPNPAQKSSSVFYELPENYAQSYVLVYNLQGQILGQFFIENNTGNFALNNLNTSEGQALFLQVIKADLPCLFYKNLILFE